MSKRKLTRTVHNQSDKDQLLKFLGNKSGTFTVVISDGVVKKRSTDQNRLQRKWLQEAEIQGDMRAEEYRAYCKLHFGVPILRNSDDEFREKYDKVVKPYSYEEKLKFMAEPFDFPVTRIMNTSEKTQYLNQMWQFFVGECGFVLTDPEVMKYEKAS